MNIFFGFLSVHGTDIERTGVFLERAPDARRAIESAGLSVKDFVLTSLALGQALTFPERVRVLIPRENVVFVERNRADVEHLRQTRRDDDRLERRDRDDDDRRGPNRGRRRGDHDDDRGDRGRRGGRRGPG